MKAVEEAIEKFKPGESVNIEALMTTAIAVIGGPLGKELKESVSGLMKEVGSLLDTLDSVKKDMPTLLAKAGSFMKAITKNESVAAGVTKAIAATQMAKQLMVSTSSLTDPMQVGAGIANLVCLFSPELRPPANKILAVMAAMERQATNLLKKEKADMKSLVDDLVVVATTVNSNLEVAARRIGRVCYILLDGLEDIRGKNYSLLLVLDPAVRCVGSVANELNPSNSEAVGVAINVVSLVLNHFTSGDKVVKMKKIDWEHTIDTVACLVVRFNKKYKPLADQFCIVSRLVLRLHSIDADLKDKFRESSEIEFVRNRLYEMACVVGFYEPRVLEFIPLMVDMINLVDLISALPAVNLKTRITNGGGLRPPGGDDSFGEEVVQVPISSIQQEKVKLQLATVVRLAGSTILPLQTRTFHLPQQSRSICDSC